jgi:hypothetical protein
VAPEFLAEKFFSIYFIDREAGVESPSSANKRLTNSVKPLSSEKETPVRRSHIQRLV